MSYQLNHYYLFALLFIFLVILIAYSLNILILV